MSVPASFGVQRARTDGDARLCLMVVASVAAAIHHYGFTAREPVPEVVRRRDDWQPNQSDIALPQH